MLDYSISNGSTVRGGARPGRLGAHLRHWLVRLYWGVFRPRTLGVRAVVVDDGGNILLVRHTYDAMWYLPGGGVARNESAQAAIARELREEIGLEAPAIARILGVYHSLAERKDDHVVVMIVGISGTRMARLMATDRREVAEIAVVAAGALPDGTSPATCRRIAEYMSGAQVVGPW